MVSVRLLAILHILTGAFSKECYKDVRLASIPSDHLYWKLKTPLVIGYMGNVMEFQENTLEGVKSLISIKADGVHMQIQLTKDQKLVLFGDDSLYRLTANDYDIRKIPYSAIETMDILKTIEYTSGTDKIKKTYRSMLKIPLLSSVLDVLRNENMLIYIEIRPNHVPPDGPFDRFMAEITAEKLAIMIKEYNLEKKVFVVSKDAFALKSLNFYNPKIVTGWWMDKTFFTPSIAENIRSQYHDILDIYPQTCFQDKPNGTLFTKYLLTSGIISKTINASIVDLSIDIYNNKIYYKDKVDTELKDIVTTNYGKLTFGSFDIFSFHSAKASKEEDVKFIDNAYKKGVNRFITNDVNRVKRALSEVITVYSTASRIQNYLVIFIITILLGKAVVSIMFL